MAEAKVTTGSSGDAAQIHGRSSPVAAGDDEHGQPGIIGAQAAGLDRPPTHPVGSTG